MGNAHVAGLPEGDRQNLAELAGDLGVRQNETDRAHSPPGDFCRPQLVCRTFPHVACRPRRLRRSFSRQSSRASQSSTRSKPSRKQCKQREGPFLSPFPAQKQSPEPVVESSCCLRTRIPILIPTPRSAQGLSRRGGGARRAVWAPPHVRGRFPGLYFSQPAEPLSISLLARSSAQGVPWPTQLAPSPRVNVAAPAGCHPPPTEPARSEAQLRRHAPGRRQRREQPGERDGLLLKSVTSRTFPTFRPRRDCGDWR